MRCPTTAPVLLRQVQCIPCLRAQGEGASAAAARLHGAQLPGPGGLIRQAAACVGNWGRHRGRRWRDLAEGQGARRAAACTVAAGECTAVSVVARVRAKGTRDGGTGA